MRRFYNKGAKGLSGGQVKLDKMGNNDGKISGEDFAVIRSRKMGGGMMKRPMYKAGTPKKGNETMYKPYNRKNLLESAKKAKERNKKQDARKKEINEAAKKFKVGGGGKYKYGPHKVDVNRRATESLFGRGKIQEKIIKFADKVDKKLEDRRKNKKANGGMMEEAKEINSKIKNSRTLKMGGGMMKRNMYKAGGSDASKFHTKKDGTKARKGLYYYMNRAKKKGTSKPGKGTVTDKALKASAKTAKKPTKKA